MAVPISNVTRRVVFSPSGTGPYAFTFEILAQTDIEVYKGDTLLTLTTDYSVTINANGTGSVTLVATAGTDNITIIGARAIQRLSDFVTGGDFFANTVNDELDSLTIFAQQNSEAVSRALQAPETDPTTINMTLPRAATRANKTLAFDSNGNPVIGEIIGDNRGNWAAGVAYNKRDIVKDTSNNNIYLANTAHTSSGSQPISSNADSAKWDLLVDAASAAAAQAAAEAAQAAAEAAQAAAETAETNAEAFELSANNWATKTDGPVAGGEYSAKYHAQAASTSASNASSAQTAAEAARDATLAAYDSFDDRYLGAKASDPALDNDGNALLAGALYYNTTVPEMRLYTGSAWVAAYVSGSSYLPITGGTLTGALTAPDVTISASVGRLSIKSTSNIYSRIDFGDAADSDIGQIYYDHPNNAMKFYTNNAEQMTISNAGAVTFNGQAILSEIKETVYTLGTSGSIALDPANGSIQSCVATGAPTFTDSLETGQTLVLHLENGDTYAPTWPSPITWATSAGNAAPTVTNKDVFVFWKISTTLYAAYVGSYV